MLDPAVEVLNGRLVATKHELAAGYGIEALLDAVCGAEILIENDLTEPLRGEVGRGAGSIVYGRCPEQDVLLGARDVPRGHRQDEGHRKLLTPDA